MKRNALIFLFLVVTLITTLLSSCNTDRVQVNSLGIKMIKIPAGSFMMGDSSGNWDEIPVHKVTISKSFYISETEVTIEQFRQFEKEYKGYQTYSPYSTGISWYKAKDFCNWLSNKEGKNYRLPTESEWEYVCKNRNAWDIKNMLDTTLEWCYDWYGPFRDTVQTDPIGDERGIAKVVRGGLPDIFIKGYSHPENFYYRSGNRSGIAPAFDGFIVPIKYDETSLPTKNKTIDLIGLAGIVYDDLEMKKPLTLFPLPIANSTKLKWISMNNWSAKWQGFIEVQFSGKVTFKVESDNKISIDIADKTVINGVGNGKSFTGAISLISGKKYPIQIKYLHDGGKSLLKLFWSWEGKNEEIIPSGAFTHTNHDKNEIDEEYKKGVFLRYVNPSIGFRIVQAQELKSKPLPYETPFVQQCVKQMPININAGPKNLYFRKRYLHTLPPDNSSREEIIFSGLHPSFGNHNHHPSLVVCPNGDLLAVYFTSEYEDAPEVSIMGSRLRYGSDEWDMPTQIIDFPDVNDVSPLFWRDGNKLYLFWGNIHLKGGYPFQWIESTDNGATFSEVKFPKIKNVSDGFAPQPITSIFRDNDGTIYMACDGVGAHSFLWASKDNGTTWFDTGGRTGGRHTSIIPLKNGSFFGVGGKKSDIDGFMPISISTDRGKTWKLSKSIFPSLGGGQRPALIRLKSGRLLYAGDFQRKDGFQPEGIKERGAFVALSNDEGKTWTIKKIPGTLESSKEETAKKMRGETIGYVSLAQSANGMIHLITSKNAPALHFEFNEKWILSDKNFSDDDSVIMKSLSTHISHVKRLEETYPDGKIKVRFSGGIANDGRFLLDGKEEWYYKNGNLKYEAEYKLGNKFGVEKYYSEKGKTRWERKFEGDRFTWILYWDNGKLKSESQWKNMKCNGIAIYRDRKGKLIREVTFIDGKIIK